MTLDKQSEQAMLTIGKGFRQGPFALYAGLLVLVVFLLMNNLAAVAADAEADSTKKEPTALQKVKTAMAEWIEGPMGKELESRGYQFFTGIYEVAIKTSRRQWSKVRSVSYSGAFVDAVANYASFMGEEILSEIESEFYEDDIQASHVKYEGDQALNSFVERMLAKGMALTEHQLTQKLAEVGMSDDEIQRLEPVQIVPTLVNAYISEVITTALERTAGLVPIVTFEEIDKNGNSAIGVVTLVDERMMRLAEDILADEPIPPDPSRAGRPIRDRIASYEDAELAKEFGIRVWWDEQGYPTVVAFGQAGATSSSRAADIKARNDARQHLANFINSSTNVLNRTKTKNIVERGYKVGRDGSKQRYDDKIMRDIVNETIKIKAEVTIDGVKTIKSWSAPHPIVEGHEIVGEVIAWSPRTQNIARVIAGKEERHAPEIDSQDQSEESGRGGSLKSRDPDLNDF